MALVVLFCAASVNYGYPDPASLALRAAARSGNMAALSSIVHSMGRNGIDLEPALGEASSYGRVKAMKFLISRGAHDYSGALVKASLRNQIAAVRYLLDHGDAHIDDQDLLMARLAAGSADSTEAEFYLHVHLMHH